MRGYVWLAAILALVLSANPVTAQTTAPTISSGGILSAAGLAAEPVDLAAPGSLISIFGKNLATTTAAATTVPLPRDFNGTAVVMNNLFAPLAFISPNQINAQIPFEIQPGATVNVVVWVNGRASAPELMRVEPAVPGIFAVSGNGTGPAVVLHANSARVTSDSPALPGEEIVILCTGLGLTLTSATAPPLASGAPGSGQPTLLGPGVTIGKGTAVVTFAGAAPGQVGQYVIRAVVPDVPVGDQLLAVTIGGRTTQAAVVVPVGNPFSRPGGPSVPPPTIFPGGIINAASLALAPDNQAAPGGLISIFGTTLATSTTGASTAPLPFSLSGTSVLIGNLSAPLLLVSPTQINAQVPFEIQPGATVNVVVSVNGLASSPEPLQIAAAAPGIFSAAGSGTGPAKVLHAANSTLVDTSSPAVPGEELVIFSTGLGATLSTGGRPAVKTGEAARCQLTPVTNCPLTLVTPTATIGGKDARVTFSGAAPDLVGQYVVKVLVPDVPAGDQDIILTAASNKSRSAITLRVGFLFAQPPAFLQMRLEGSFTARFTFKVRKRDADDPTLETVVPADVIKIVPCTIDLAGTTGPTYTALVHCQDYSDPKNLIAIILGLRNGTFANNKLVFTSILASTINQFFFDGPASTVSGPVFISAVSPVTEGALSLDMKRPDFAELDKIIGTLNVKLTLDSTLIGGTFTDTITFLRR